MKVTLLNKSVQSMTLAHARSFTVAFNIKSKFEAAYNQKMATLKKIPTKM